MFAMFGISFFSVALIEGLLVTFNSFFASLAFSSRVLVCFILGPSIAFLLKLLKSDGFGSVSATGLSAFLVGGLNFGFLEITFGACFFTSTEATGATGAMVAAGAVVTLDGLSIELLIAAIF